MDKNEKYLSKLLQGESMGINLYTKYLKKLPSGEVKREVESFLEEHKRHKKRIENMMEMHKIQVKDKIGFSGKMAETIEATKLIFKHKPKDILNYLYKGEVMGITYTQKYLMEISEELKPDIKKIVEEDRERLNKIQIALIKCKA